MSGVTIGRIESITYDFKEYRARVTLRIRNPSTAFLTTATRAS
jgi:ABC-type transporter Mla subunit MlaD